MADVILFHHAQGLTQGVRAFAERLEEAGHQLTVPDLYGGRTFGTLEEGVAHAEALGMESVIAAGVEEAELLPSDLVYAGFSLGALVAHKLAQTRPGSRGALLYHHGDVPLETFGETWPAGVGLQIHVSEHDEFFEPAIVHDFVVRVSEGAQAELFVYPGSTHLFTDSSLPGYEPDSTSLVLTRSLDFLTNSG